MSVASVQIFGTRKCADTRKAERFFKERRISFQLIDIAEKGPSPGELRKIAGAVGGVEALIDREGRRYLERGLKYAAPTGARIEQALLDDPLLMRTPVVRAGPRATVGFVPDVWLGWLSSN
jgi:arsenate reductase-like glutaredoxin family protein